MLTLLDSVDYAHDRLLLRLTVARRLALLALHPVCSMHHAGTQDKQRAIAAALAEEVFIPPSPSCCGFAGDRDFLHPELTQSGNSPANARQPALRLARLRHSSTANSGHRRGTLIS